MSSPCAPTDAAATTLFRRVEHHGDVEVQVHTVRIDDGKRAARIEIRLSARGQSALVDVPDTGDPDHIATQVAAVFAQGLQIGP